MPIPTTAKALAQPMDPTDVEVQQVIISREGESAEPYPILQAAEDVASYSLALPTESVAAGLQIRNADGYSSSLYNRKLLFWLSVDLAMQTSPIFDGAGVVLAIELTITTTNTPPRRKQRTVTVNVRQS